MINQSQLSTNYSLSPVSRHSYLTMLYKYNESSESYNI